MSASSKLPYSRQCIDEDDIAAVNAVLRGDWLTTGPTVDAFERAFAERVGADYAVSCSNGTAALHLAAMALDLAPGDSVVVPAMTFLATANAARYVGAEVIFADVDPETGLMTEESFAAAVARGGASDADVRATFPVHLNGQCVDMSALSGLARDRDIAVVEDACHAIGGTIDPGGRPVGDCHFGAMAAFSLHPVKTIAMGEGGVVTTNDEDTYRRIKRDRNHGMVRDPELFEAREWAFDGEGRAYPWYYEMPEPGFNYRASDIHCALGLSQLSKLDRFVAARNALVARYDGALAGLAPVVRPIPRVPWCCAAWHLYAVQIDFAALGRGRAAVMGDLAAAGVETQVHYLPLHLQPYYARRYGPQSLPGAEHYYARALSLPLFPAMSTGDVDRVVAELERACRS